MAIRCVVFDLGGVLVDLGGVREFGEMIGEPDDTRVWSRWLESRWVRDYERGRCSTERFARGLVEEFALTCSPDEFLERFRVWPRGLKGGAYELVKGLALHVQVACLSNTNELHWGHQADAFRLADLFPTRFLSHELGLVKPDREIFEHVVEALSVPADAILFFDDNPPNVDAAREAGLRAERVEGPAAARTCLSRYGLGEAEPASRSQPGGA